MYHKLTQSLFVDLDWSSNPSSSLLWVLLQLKDVLYCLHNKVSTVIISNLPQYNYTTWLQQ